jgi:short-subunit dehydrogenase
MAQNRNYWMLAAGIGVGMAARAIVRKMRSYDLHVKHVLITGGSRGLGLVLARQLAQQGARLSICSRDAEELDRARQDLSAYGEDVFTATCDVTVQSDVERLVREVRDHFGPIDVLVNNAGVIQVGPFENMTLKEYEEAMQTHFYAPLYTVLAVAPEMQQRKKGRIVNISSFGGKVSAPHLLPYCASKFALVGFSKGLRSELSKDGVWVTTVCPGLVRTGSPRNVIVKGQHESEYNWFKTGDSIPLLSASAESAASQILDALKHGDAELVITVPAKLATVVNELFPEFTADVLSLINRFLPAPAPDGADNPRLRGYQSETESSHSGLARLSDQAAEKNNEIPGNPPEGNLPEPSHQIDSPNPYEAGMG